MVIGLAEYLDRVRHDLHLSQDEESDVLRELTAHIEERVDELRQTGLSAEEASRNCLNNMGSARLFAHGVYEAHSRTAWRQTLLAALPHVLFGAIFALNWWQYVWSAVLTITLVVSLVVYGWYRVKPRWLFPWLGYSLMPVLAASLLLLFLPTGFAWVAWPIYTLLFCGLVRYFYHRTRNRDWLYASLMLFPVPTLIAWLMVVMEGGAFPAYTLDRLDSFAPWIGVSFMAFGGVVVLFMRLRRRWLKGLVLVVSGLLSLALVSHYAQGKLDLPAFLLLSFLMLVLFVLPALLERKVWYRR